MGWVIVLASCSLFPSQELDVSWLCADGVVGQEQKYFQKLKDSNWFKSILINSGNCFAIGSCNNQLLINV